MFDSEYLALFLSERNEIRSCWGSGQSKRIPRISWTLSGGPVIPRGDSALPED